MDPNLQQFSEIPERNTGDNVLRTAQQHHVQMSMMADTKANIIITVSSIVLTMALGRSRDELHGPSALVLAVFTMLALILAILAVLLLPGATLPQECTDYGTGDALQLGYQSMSRSRRAAEVQGDQGARAVLAVGVQHPVLRPFRADPARTLSR